MTTKNGSSVMSGLLVQHVQAVLAECSDAEREALYAELERIRLRVEAALNAEVMAPTVEGHLA